MSSHSEGRRLQQHYDALPAEEAQQHSEEEGGQRTRAPASDTESDRFTRGRESNQDKAGRGVHPAGECN